MDVSKTSGGTVLYTAATESLVSDASATSTFEKMISVAFTHATVETFQKEIRDTEQQIRKDFEVTPMPGPWRSSKSVIQGAMKLSIPLIDENGGYYGKTSLQNKIKELKAEPKEELTATDYANKAIAVLLKVPDGLKQQVQDMVAEFINNA